MGAASDAALEIASLGDELLAARAADVRDVGARIARILRGETLALPDAPVIAIADDLPPSVTAEIPAAFLRGIALSGGSRTAHAVILARGLGIPCVVGCTGLLEALDDAAAGGAPVEIALDGEAGEVLIDPDAAAKDALAGRAAALAERRARAAAARGRPGATADGSRVLLVANIGNPDDAPRALDAGAEGVGHFRTEFHFMQRQAPPAEDEQVAAYRRAFEAFGPARPVVVRLADIGGDKAIPYQAAPGGEPVPGRAGDPPAYGDLSLDEPAIWRAGGLPASGPTSGADGRHARGRRPADLLRDDARAAARRRPAVRRGDGDQTWRDPCGRPPGPRARSQGRVLQHRHERPDPVPDGRRPGQRRAGPVPDALHPAVLRAIAGVVAGADAAGIPVAVCGELAGDPAGALVLVGLGVDELSADAGSLDEVRAALAAVTRPELEELARAALVAPDATAVRVMATKLLGRVAGVAGEGGSPA
jgi:phosphocarrier protein FPr